MFSAMRLAMLSSLTSYVFQSSVQAVSDEDFVYQDFIPNSETRTCRNDTHSRPFNKQVRGVNLGGFLILEPWLTPSLFYQFLSTQERFGDDAPSKTGMDMYTFCKALGPVEGNKQLRLHWSKWVTERDIERLAQAGLNSLRIPVGDWMFMPDGGYGPYIGCTDGSVAELTRVLDLAHKYHLDVLLDIHAHRGSQNGFDNSGMGHKIEWTSLASTLPLGTTTFEHWPIRTAEWIGTFDRANRNYSSINRDNIASSLAVMHNLTSLYKDHPAVLGIEPINEPWELTPIAELKAFYWDGYLQTKRLAPSWKYFLHDSFRFGIAYWGGFMKGCPDIALDTHIYQAWNSPGSAPDFSANACQQKFTISAMEESSFPVVVGEWSLATDNCAMWINGFNDNLPGFPKVQCASIPCPASYLGPTFTGNTLDATKPIQGPYGTGTSGPSFGQCPVSNTQRFVDASGKDETFYAQLAMKKLNAFTVGHGFYFWNFKTELDTKWDFLRLVDAGTLVLNNSQAMSEACQAEDQGNFICAAKRGGVHESDLRRNFDFACSHLPGVSCDALQATFPNLLDRCDYVFNLYWQKNRLFGATCDFGGSASLRSPIVKQPSVESLVTLSLRQETSSVPVSAVALEHDEGLRLENETRTMEGQTMPVHGITSNDTEPVADPATVVPPSSDASFVSSSITTSWGITTWAMVLTGGVVVVALLMKAVRQWRVWTTSRGTTYTAL